MVSCFSYAIFQKGGLPMASLRDMVSEYQDDLRNGIAWLAFWREGRGLQRYRPPTHGPLW